MASSQVVETSVNTNNSPSQDYTTNPDDHSNHNRNKIYFLTQYALSKASRKVYFALSVLHARIIREIFRSSVGQVRAKFVFSETFFGDRRRPELQCKDHFLSEIFRSSMDHVREKIVFSKLSSATHE